LIANETYPEALEKVCEKFPDARCRADHLKQYYFAGALFPDLGNYPGGDSMLSDLAHNLRTWDLAKEMLDSAVTKEELVFAYGWALHVITDIIGHPEFTNISHAEITGAIQEFPSGVEAYSQPLEHKKTEFGASAYLLGLDTYLYLWDTRLSWPFEIVNDAPKSIVEKAFEKIYAYTIPRDKLKAGMRGLAKEMLRIPVVMKFLGHVKGGRYDFLERILAAFLRNLVIPVYLSMIDEKKNQGKIAVLKPFKLGQKQIDRLHAVNGKVVDLYKKHASEQFFRMANTNLDSGVGPLTGNSKHADHLMKQLIDSGIERRFNDFFGRDTEPLNSWIHFKKLFFNSTHP
jgi:hypothetical protein